MDAIVQAIENYRACQQVVADQLFQIETQPQTPEACAQAATLRALIDVYLEDIAILESAR